MSIISFTTYQVPGVYVQQSSNPTTATVAGLASPVVGLVGPSLGYKTNTETQLMGAAGALNTLNHTGVNQSSLVVTNSSGTSYVLGTDYAVATITGTSAPYNQTTITPIAGGAISSGTVVYCTYQYTDENYFLPATYNNANAVISDFGQPFTASGAIASPISLAAILAFLNGAATVVVLPTADTGTVTASGGFSGVATTSNLAAAYPLLETTDVDIIVPLLVGITNSNAATAGYGLGSFLTAQASTAALFAVGILGFETVVTNGPDGLANSFPNSRLVEVWPNNWLYNNGTANITVGGYYLAAAVAGLLSAGEPQTPLTRKIVSGFSGIPQTVQSQMTLAYKNQLSSAGVSVFEATPGGGYWCRQGVTTSTTSESTQEISLVREADAIVELIMSTINASGLIGSAFESTTISTLTSLVQGALNNLVDEGTIISFDSLSVVESATTPVVANISFNYTPAYPLNYVLVQFGVDSSGLVTSSTATSTTAGS